MARKESIVDTKHFRYFVYSVENHGDEPTIRYRISTGSWSLRFNDAMLWESEEFAQKKARELLRIEKKFRNARGNCVTMCVGRVVVESDPFYVGKATNV